MYFKALNSPELKHIRGKVKYSCFIPKTSELLETINHTSHKTLKPLFNYDTVKSSETTDKIGDNYIITINDNGKLTFKEEDTIITNYDDYEVLDLTTTSTTYTYHEFISYDKYTGEIIGDIPFTFNDKKYTTNDDGYYIIEVPV